MPRAREKLTLANGPHPKIKTQSDEIPHIHLSHTVVQTRELEEELLRCSGLRYRCFSFVYIDPKAIYWSPRAFEAYKVNVDKGSVIMMDSGAFSFQMFALKKKKSLREIEESIAKTLDEYVAFCKDNKKDWAWYVTFDYTQKSELVWDVTKKLKERGLKDVVPVFHGDQDTEWLKKYLDMGCKRIGISSLPSRKQNYKNSRFYLDNVFRICEPYKVKLHGFAVTSLTLMYAYPWDSVDSSAWSRTASFGAIYIPDYDRGILACVHVSKTGGLTEGTLECSVTKLSPEAKKSVRAYVESKGWDYDLLQRSLQYRFIYNAWLFSNMNSFKEKLETRHYRMEALWV